MKHFRFQFRSFTKNFDTMNLNHFLLKDVMPKLFNRVIMSSHHSIQNSARVSTTATVYAVHTIKGWKKSVLKEENHPLNSENPPLACEEGRDAVQHSVLLNQLQNCNSVSSQIDTLCSILSLTPEEKERRQAFVQALDDKFKMYFSKCETTLFGSSMNGLGFKGCDADVCIKTNFTDQDSVRLGEVPTPESVLDGTISQEVILKMNPLYQLRFIRRVLRMHFDADIKEPIMLIKARCPILRFYSTKYDLFCDFSSESGLSLQNTRLLHLLSHLDERFATISKVVRYWGKHAGFIGDIEMFNSYSSSLLVTYFFQKTEPPIFPSIQEIYAKSEYLKSRCIDSEELLMNDLKKFPISSNTKCAEELLKEFYFYFLCYDYSRVMKPFSSSSVLKTEFQPIKFEGDVFEFGAVNLQDPFRAAFNATFGASFKNGKRFLNSIIHSCQMFQDHSSWIPRENAWGLCNLFLPPLGESFINKKWLEDKYHRIELPPKQNLPSKLRQVLEYGLMFECKERATDHTQILKFECKAVCNTWQGRDQVREENESMCGLPTLEQEHLISTELVKCKKTDRRTLLCEFDCVGRETGTDSDKKVELVFSFKESKFPPVVAVFLKEYLPVVLNKC